MKLEKLIPPGGVIEPLPSEKNDFLANLEGAEETGQATYDDNENLRYIGQDPSNYIWFNCDDYDFTSAEEAASKNCEKWRIIGLFGNVQKTEGGQEDLVKIIRADSIGTIAWDSANSNNWTTASLQTSLNTTYYNGTTLSSGKGITDKTRPMIEQVTWNLGGWSTASGVLASQWYEYERGETVPSGAPTTWDGYIGLMYPSDYGYATSGGGSTDRDACLAKDLYNWDTGNFKTDCAGNSWLWDSSTAQWTLAPFSSNSYLVFFVDYAGCVYSSDVATYAFGVRPSLYLKSNVQIANGEGTSSEPYIPKVA